MESLELIIGIAVLVLLALGGGLVALLRRGRARDRTSAPTRPQPGVDYRPGVGDDAEVPRDSPTRTIETVPGPDSFPEAGPSDVTEVERPDPVAGRMVRLRARLARSNSALGRGLLTLLTRDRIDEATWDEVEETLLLADLGVGPTTELVDRLRERVAVEGSSDPVAVTAMLRQELIALVDPSMDRSLAVERTGPLPAVVLVVGVNGTGKTTTVGKLARVLVAQDKDVVLGAADTFRAAAADQLTTWGERVGVPTVRADREGADPASVAFDAVAAGVEMEADVVLVDTAGRLQNKVGLMDELGKVKRVAEKALGEGGAISEVLLVLDATTGQNGMRQAQVFAEVVNVTGIVLTKLDGTAKGGIVVAVQRELGCPGQARRPGRGGGRPRAVRPGGVRGRPARLTVDSTVEGAVDVRPEGDDTPADRPYARPVRSDPARPATEPGGVVLGDDWERPGPDRAQQRRDVVVGLALAALALVGWELSRDVGIFESADTSSAEQIAWTVAVALPLCVRRRHPVAQMLAVSALFLGVGLREPVVSAQFTVQGYLFISLFAAAAWGRDRRVTRLALGGVLLVMFVWLALVIGSGSLMDQLYGPDGPDPGGLLPAYTAAAVFNVVVNLLYFVGAWVAGEATWRSARQREQLRQQATALREQQHAEARRAVLAERLRIARELHDVAAHHVSVIGVQAAAARRVLGVDGEAAGRALTAVEQSSRSAVGEMRQLLGVLRSDGEYGRSEDDSADGENRSPQPGLDDLGALVEEVGDAGPQVDLHRVGAPRPVPTTVELSLYRTVQEALVNVRRHSTAASASVTLRFSDPEPAPAWVEVEVVDDGRPRPQVSGGSGLGHLGMRERAAMHGGEAEIGRRPFGGYRVRVRYPLDREAWQPAPAPTRSDDAEVV